MAELDLTPEELRVLGCLVEKAYTTPDQYPLSTNALTTACNQKTSRDPVVDYSSRTVIDTMLSLRAKGLARTGTAGGRVEKHRHVLDEALGLDPAEQAVLAVLALRGPQSAPELRTRTERYVDLATPAEVEAVLDRLAAHDPPLVTDIGRGSGQTQNRWVQFITDPDLAPDPAPADPTAPAVVAAPPHTVAGVPAPFPDATRPVGGMAPPSPGPGAPPAGSDVARLLDRLARLEERVGHLESELGLAPPPPARGDAPTVPPDHPR
ncbi:MAG: YceH family protein [Acidimicrobiales bacterium]